MRNNVIAIVAVSFAIVGGLWGIGNLMKQSEPSEPVEVEGILLVAENGAFNKTNPDLTASTNKPIKLTVLNNDVVTHDLKIEDKSKGILEIDTAPLRPGQDFITAILAYRPGTYSYYCSYHPEMTGNIVVT